jgi:hypothetical protein
MPNMCDILALTTARKPMKNTSRARKTADTMMIVGPCDAATFVVVVAVVDISHTILLYRQQCPNKLITETN